LNSGALREIELMRRIEKDLDTPSMNTIEPDFQSPP